MRIRLAVPDELDDQDRKAALDAALESVTRTVTGLVRAGSVPPAAGEIKKGRIKWKPEPPGDEHFDLPGTVLQRGWGDCDDLAPYHAGSLRAGGIDPGARAIVKRSGPKRWHAIVQRSDGSIEDPSLHAGMHKVSGPGGVEVVGAFAPMQPPMTADGRLCLAICPTTDMRHPLVYFARCDVPDRLEPWDWSSMAAHPSPMQAVLKSIKTVRKVAGDDLDPEDDARLAAVHDLVMGADPDDVYEALEELMGDHVDVVGCMEDAVHSVGFFGDILKAAVSPITSAVKFVKKPSLSSFGQMFTDPITSHFKAGMGVIKNPMVNQVLKAGIPIAATAFGGPLGTAAGGMLTQFLPGPSGGGGGPRPAVRMPMAAPGGGGGFDMGSLMRMFQGMQGGGAGFGLPFKLPFLSGVDGQPSFGYEGGQVVRPWGPNGPAVMRF